MNISSHFYQRYENWVVLLLLLLLSYPLFFHKLGDRDIWSPDEDEYVQVNREMVRDGHWIFPTANGRPYYIKPPLFNWLGSALSLLNGKVTEYTSRLPSATAAALGLVLIYFLGKRLFGQRAALLSALILGTTPLYIEFGRWIQINMISTVLLTACLVLFYRGYTDERKRPAAYLLMYVPAGLGTLNMGPVNVVMPVIIISLYLIAVKDFKHILRLKIGWGILIYLAIVAPWTILVMLQGEQVRQTFVLSNFTRYFGEFAHARPFYYYLTTTPPYFLPWFVYLPGAFYFCFSRHTLAQRRQLLLPFVWIVGLFVFFSLSNTKRSEYLLPIFPAMALLAGYAIDCGLKTESDSPLRRRLLAWPTYTLLGILTAAGTGAAVYGALVSKAWLFTVLPLSLMLCLGASAAFFLFRCGRQMQSVFVVVFTLVLSLTYSVGPIVAKRNENKSVKPFCNLILPYLRPGENLKMFRFYKLAIGIYTDRFIEEIYTAEALEKWFRTQAPVYVVTQEKEYLKIKDSFPLPIYVVVRRWIDHRYVLLLSNRPAPAGSQTGAEANAPGDKNIESVFNANLPAQNTPRRFDAGGHLAAGL